MKKKQLGTLENIYNKINSYVEKSYGEFDFKEILLYTLSVQELNELCKTIEFMPILNKSEGDALVKIFKLYNFFNNIDIIESTEEAAAVFEKMNTDIEIVYLVKNNELICTNMDNGNWNLKMNKNLKYIQVED